MNFHGSTFSSKPSPTDLDATTPETRNVQSCCEDSTALVPNFRDDEDEDDAFPRRKVVPRNIVFRLRSRETGSPSAPPFRRRHIPGSASNAAHFLHTSVLPNATVCDVAKPAITLRRFSPDGKLLLAFSFDFKSILVYRFKGASAANEALSSKLAGRNLVGNSSMTGDEDVFNEVINDVESRAEIFDRFFQLQRVVMMPARVNSHNFRNVCLFTGDGRRVILASTSLLQDGGDEPGNGIMQPQYAGSDTSDLGERSHYKLWILDLASGEFTGERTFHEDRLHMTHSGQGLDLYNDVLSVVSVGTQTIHLLRIRDDGQFQTMDSVGKFCSLADEALWRSTYSSPTSGNNNNHHHTSVVVNSHHRQFGAYEEVVYDWRSDASLDALKQRILAHLYRRALPDPQSRRHFYRIFDQLVQLKMMKAQLIDERTLFVKYTTAEALTSMSRGTESSGNGASAYPSFFLVFDFVSSKVLLFCGVESGLLELLEAFYDSFRRPSSRFTSCISNCVFSWRQHDQLKAIITNARFGGSAEAVKRLLLQLPCYSQSFSPSPYLDMVLFSYDDKLISPSDRPKCPSEGAIRFYDRQTGLLAFRLHTGFAESHSPANRGHNRYRFKTHFIPHPSQPFLISVQMTESGYNVLNFHLRYQHFVS